MAGGGVGVDTGADVVAAGADGDVAAGASDFSSSNGFLTSGGTTGLAANGGTIGLAANGGTTGGTIGAPASGGTTGFPSGAAPGNPGVPSPGTPGLSVTISRNHCCGPNGLSGLLFGFNGFSGILILLYFNNYAFTLVRKTISPSNTSLCKVSSLRGISKRNFPISLPVSSTTLTRRL